MVFIGIGAMLGACIRVYVSQFNGQFPMITLLLNIIGSFILGCVCQTEWMLLIGTGMMGGLTTFSTFSVDSVRLLKRDLFHGLIYIGCSIALPPAAFFAALLIL